MAIITLTTDFGTQDASVASVKGALLSQLPETTIVDISHEIPPFDLGSAAYLIQKTYPNFPTGSIHIIGIDALPQKNKPLIAAYMAGHYFLCANNGVLSLLYSEVRPEQVVKISIDKFDEFSNFPTKDVLVPVACHIARGGKLTVIGRETSELKKLAQLQPQLKENKSIVATIIHIDNFGNLITNLRQDVFNKFGKGRSFEIHVRNHKFREIFKRYSDVVIDFNDEINYHGNHIALFNSNKFLEIAVYKSNPQTIGSANSLMGMEKGDSVVIKFN